VEESDDDDEEPKSELQLMYNTVRGYVSAIMKLYNHQISMRLHSSPSPHNVAIKAIKTSIARGQHQHRRAEFEDRGIATIKDGYTAKQIPDMTQAVWRNALGPRTSEQSFRTNLDFLLGHAMLLRQSNQLPLELPDLFAMDLPKEGQKGTCWCFVVVMDQGKHYPSLFLGFSAPASISVGKTNQHGRLEYGAALRHRDHRSCLVGSLAIYLFWRWHRSGEAFPCFRTSPDWFVSIIILG
jgi:centromere DNA-binding complex CBF3 subunit-like protein